MNATILLIDDNDDILEFLSEVHSDRYNLHVARNVEGALGILADYAVDLIITDIVMPGKNGFEFCQNIKTKIEYCHIPVILLTSKNTYKAQIDGLQVGADAYIQKPFSPEFLQLQIDNLLNNRRKCRSHWANSPFQDYRVLAHSKSDILFLERLESYIRKNLMDVNMCVATLANHMNTSRPTFYRRLTSLSSLSPKELIDLTRIKKATELIAANQYTMFEISKLVGYNSQTVFVNNFHKHHNMSPVAYQASLVRRTIESTRV
jgi:DNA-binding response OmpR family regulator